MKNVLHTGSLSRALHVLKALFLNRWHIMLKSFLICTQVPVLYNNTIKSLSSQCGTLATYDKKLSVRSSICTFYWSDKIKKMSTYVRHASKSSLSHILLLPFWFFIFFNSCGIKKKTHPAVKHISYPQKNALLYDRVPSMATVHFLTSLFSKSEVMVYIFCYFLNNFKPAVKHVLKPSINWR